MDLSKDIQYLKHHLEGKPELSTEELSQYILYDLFIKHLDNTNVDNFVDNVENLKSNDFNQLILALKNYEYGKIDYKSNKNNDKLVEITTLLMKEFIDIFTNIYNNCDTQQERDLVVKTIGILNKL